MPRSFCVLLAALFVSCYARCESPPAASAQPQAAVAGQSSKQEINPAYSSMSLNALARKMKEAVDLPVLRLKVRVHFYVENTEQPVLSEEITAIVLGPRSRVERASADVSETGEIRNEKMTVSVFDGRQYRKLTTFKDGRQSLAWEGTEDLNGAEVEPFLLGGLTLDKVDDFELNPGRYFEVYNQNSGLFEIHVGSPSSTIVHVDPEHGFLVKRVENRDENREPVHVCEMAFRDIDGRWFPSEQRIDSYSDGALRPNVIIRIEPPDMDPSADPSLFQVSFPPDARVMPAEVSLAEVDKMRAESGLEGKEQNLAAASNPSGENTPPQQETLSGNVSENKPKEQDAKPRGPWTPFNVAVAIALGVLLGLYWRTRRRQ